MQKLCEQELMGSIKVGYFAILNVAVEVKPENPDYGYKDM